ncbi:hypothetical protein PISMIDRAFT_115201, partial [Pisolithus microcarpus 441]
DCRDRRDRIELQINHWDAQMPRLVKAYLDFHSCSSDNGFSVEEHPEAFVMPENRSPDIITEIELVDIFSRRKASLMARPHHTFPNENLIYHGYLGCSPVYLTVAISLRTLTIFRQVCHACPCFSIHAQCKTLCHLHNVRQFHVVICSVLTPLQMPYCPYLFQQLTQAFDMYLEIIHRVDQKIRVALNRSA